MSAIPDNNPTARKKDSNILYRSRIEICRVLEALVQNESAIFSEFGDESLFVTKILRVEENEGYLVIEYSAEKKINSELFKQPSLRFGSNFLGAVITFRLSNPQDTILKSMPAIKYEIPRSLIWANSWTQRRQENRRIVPPHISLRCTGKTADGMPFEAKIFDISQDGMGGMICDDGVILLMGSVLKACRISYPGGEPIIVDLVVRNTKTMARSDGTFYNRAGLRFIQRPDEIQALIDLFIFDLDGSIK